MLQLPDRIEDLLELALTIFVILTAIVGISLTAVYWYAVISPLVRALRRHKPLPKFRFALLQITLVLILAQTVIAPGDLVSWLSPPLAIFGYAEIIVGYRALFLEPLLWGTVVSAATFGLLAILFRRHFLNFTPAAATLALCTVTLQAAAWSADSRQTAAISQFKPDCTFPGNFRKSLRIAKQEFQFDYHLLVFKDEKAFGWSYATMDFYPINPNVIRNLNGSYGAFEECYGKPAVWEVGGPET